MKNKDSKQIRKIAQLKYSKNFRIKCMRDFEIEIIETLEEKIKELEAAQLQMKKE